MSLDLSELKLQTIGELVEAARGLGVENAAGLRRQELVFEILRQFAGQGRTARGQGVLETLPDGFGFLRSPEASYLPGPDDIYVSPSQIRRFNLRTGDLVRGQVRGPKEGERYVALLKVEDVNDRSPDDERGKPLFENLKPVHPTRWLKMEHGADATAARQVDLFAPMGFGQRVLVVAPSRAGRSTLLREIALGARRNHPALAILSVLVDERPEEVTEFRSAVAAAPAGERQRGKAGPSKTGPEPEVLATTSEEVPARHVQVAEMAIDRGRRIAEQGRDVLILLDSLTRLARALHATVPAGGRMVFGVADATALHRVRRAFSAGRCLEEGGSLTLVATALEETGSRLDEVVLEELHGAASSEIHLATPNGRGTVPAFDLLTTGTRHADRLVGQGDLARTDALRHALSADGTDPAAALRALFDRHPDNRALLDSVDRIGQEDVART